MTDQELKALIEKCIQSMMGMDKKTFDETINQMKAVSAEEGPIKKTEDAVKQLESQYKTFMADFDSKVAAAARRSYNSNQNYRGSFANEDEAREFGLNVIRLSSPADTQTRRLATEIIESEHKAFGQRLKDLTGAESLIPHEHSTRVHSLVEQYGWYSNAAFKMPMGSDQLSFTRRVSGFRARKIKYRTAGTKQDMVVAPVNLTADDWCILTSYPKQISADMIVALAEMFAQEIGLGFAIALDEDSLVGDGTANYDGELGMISLLKSINGIDDGGGLQLATGSAGDKWSGITETDIYKLIGRARYTRAGKEEMAGSQEFFWQVLAPKIAAAGGRTMMETQTRRMTLNFFGIPYSVSPAMPRTPGDSQVPLLYGDFSQASTMGNRMSMEITTSNEVYWTTKEVGVMGSARYAMNHHSLGDATNAGPVVGLITPPAAG